MDVTASYRRWMALGSAVAAGTLSLVAAAGPANAAAEHTVTTPSATVDSGLRATLRAGGTTEFLVYLRGTADLTTAAALTDRGGRAAAVYERLTATAEATQRGLRAELTARGIAYRSFWVANAV